MQVRNQNKKIFAYLFFVFISFSFFLTFVLAQPQISFGHLAKNIYLYIIDEGRWVSLQDAFDEGLFCCGGQEVNGSEGLGNLRINSVVQTGHGNTVCVIREDKKVSCTGYNAHGQIGIGDKVRRTSFKENPYLSNVTKLTAGMLYFCALYNDSGLGKVKCWGNNDRGELGVGDTSHRLIPTSVSGLENGVIDIQARKGYNGEDYVENTCALTIGGRIYCWGYNNNNHGTLGNGQSGSKSHPTLVEGIVRAKKFVLGGHSTGGYGCALLDNGTVMCWGYNGFGQLGTGTTVSAKTSVTVMNGPFPLQNVVDIIATGSDYGTTCALIRDGTVMCWGFNRYGQVGSGDKRNDYISNPTLVKNIGGSNPKAIKLVTGGAGVYTSFCAILEDKTVKCWGANNHGRIGLGQGVCGSIQGCGCKQNNNDKICYSEPTSVSGLNDIKEIQLNGWGEYGYGCAIKNNGDILCFGLNNNGQLGLGDRITRFVPTKLNVNFQADSLFLMGDIGNGKHGYYSTFVSSKGDKTLRVWGYNLFGQLGTGDTNVYTSPTKPV
ncbi:MAG: hypothetical protein QXG18_01150 [Candidatus Pacearchaeota archaeon]